MEEGKWYVVHTYSGYENAVKVDLERTIINRNLQDFIFEVSVPTEEVVEVKNGARKVIERKLFPGYVLVRMIMNQDTWYVVRNTRGVTGFVGPGSEPVPLTEEEIANLGMGERRAFVVDYKEGDEVVAITGPWRDTVGRIKSINTQKQTVTIMVELFGRETPVELGFTEVKKK